jgi:triosephosphate isomerase
MNKGPNEARKFLQEFMPLVSEAKQSNKLTDQKILIFPSPVNMEACALTISQGNQTRLIEWGSQNSYFEAQGAFTGETSAEIVKQLGGTWVLVGHSERRKIFNEADEILAKKVHFAQSLGLTPMLCIGEVLEERDSGQTNSILKRQLEVGLSAANNKKLLAVAYEPVWAIGTGRVASVQQVAEAHSFIFQVLSDLGFSSTVPILYGGSVKAENARELGQINHVGGFLVGGASLEPKSFFSICQAL